MLDHAKSLIVLAASFTGIPGTTYILRWTLTGLCTSNSDYVSISFE
jgi:hypothetical protein